MELVPEASLRVGLMTREYPPLVYGGAGVHVEYLSRELAKSIEVEVHCWGDQLSDKGNLHVRGAEPWAIITDGTQEKFKAALETFSLNLAQITSLSAIDIVHTHTWYVAMAGLLAKKLYNIPFVLTTHSLEPLRAWKAEQLGSGYVMSSWMERTAILDADAVIAVSQGTRADILRAYPEINPNRIHVIYNGIDLQEYQKTTRTTALIEYGVDPSRPYVLFVGRITRQKGVTHLVDAIPHLPHQSIVLVLGKASSPEHRPDAVAWWEETQLPDLHEIPGVLATLRFEPAQAGESELLLHVLLCSSPVNEIMRDFVQVRRYQELTGRYPAHSRAYETVAILPYDLIIPLRYDFVMSDSTE